MGKVKQTNGKSAKAAAPLSAVKDAGVTKASATPLAKSKKLAKEVASKALNGKESKSKKKVEPESESEEDDSEDSDESEDSEEEEDSEDSDDSDESEEEAKPAKQAKTNGAKKVNGAADSDSSESSESSDDDEDDDEDSDEEEEEVAKKPAAAAPAKTAPKAKSDDNDEDDDEDDSDDDSEDDDDDDDSDDDEEEEEEKAAEPTKKRKAEEDVATPVKKAKAADSEEGSSTLFVGNLSWNIDDDALYEAFKDLADLSSARVVTDRDQQRSRGFGYVDFANAEAAQAAFEKMNGSDLDGRPMRLDFSAPRPAGDDATPNARASDRAKRFGDNVSTESDTLFVGNLPFDADEDVVSEFFSDTCEVKSLRLPTDQESGNRKGFGYVTFHSIEDAKTVFNSKNGSYIGEGRGARAIRLDFANPRPPREGGGGFGGGGGGFGGGRGGGRGGFGGRGGGGFGGGRGGPRGGGGGRGGFGGRGGRGGSGGFQGKKITF